MMREIECPHCDHVGVPVHGCDRVRAGRILICESCRGEVTPARPKPAPERPRRRTRERRRADR